MTSKPKKKRATSKAKPRGASPFFDGKKRKAPPKASPRKKKAPAPDRTAENDEAAAKTEQPRELAAPPKLTAQQQTILWLVEGNRDHDVAESLRAMYPGIDPDQVLKETMQHFAEIAEADPTVIRGWCLEAFQELYRRMVQIGDYANALRAVKELYKIAS